MRWTRLGIVVEGQTEEGFVSDVLRPHFVQYEIDVFPRLLSPPSVTSRIRKGGLTSYATARRCLRALFREHQTDTYFSCMFDYYRLPDDFPGYGDCRRLPTAIERVACLESQMRADLAQDANRFVPYIQLHEFEALVLCHPDRFSETFPDVHDVMERVASLRRACANFDLPEDINDNEPPSKRILRLFPMYRKTLHGTLLIQGLGLPVLRERCPHFDAWLTKLEALGAACP